MPCLYKARTEEIPNAQSLRANRCINPPVNQGFALRAQGFKRIVFNGVLAFKMNNQRALFGLLRRVVADVNQGLNHVVKGVYLVVPHNQRVQFRRFRGQQHVGIGLLLPTGLVVERKKKITVPHRVHIYSGNKKRFLLLRLSSTAFFIFSALFSRKSTADLSHTSAEGPEPPKFPLIFVLENVRSMHNVGSVFRTCDALGLEALYLIGYTPTPPHRDIQKTALGATETVLWKHFGTTEAALADLRAQGYQIAAAEQAHGATLLDAFQPVAGEKLAVVFGNEVEGVSDVVLSVADACIEIPQFGEKHSFNISVSAGIIGWETVKKLRFQNI